MANGKKATEKPTTEELRAKFEKEFAGKTPKKLVDAWIALREDETELELKHEVLRGRLLAEVDAVCPDNTRTGELNVGDFDVQRIVSAKVTYNLPKLKELIGSTLYSQVVEVKETLGKAGQERLDKMRNEGLVKLEDIQKVAKVDFQKSLRVNLHSDAKETDTPREGIVEDLCR